MTLSVESQPNCVAWSRNDEYIAMCQLEWGDKVVVWNASTRARVSGLFSDDDRIRAQAISVAFSPADLWLASGFRDGTIRIWKMTTNGQEVVVEGGRTKVLKRATSAVLALSFSKDGRRLISGSKDGNVQMWDLEREVVIAEFSGGHQDPVWEVSFLPDQIYILSRSGSRTARVWDVKTRGMVEMPFKEVEIPTGTIHTTKVHFNLMGSTTQSPCERSSFSPSWTEAAEYEEKGNVDEWQVAAFSRDGMLVATSDDSQIRVWYAKGARAGELVNTLPLGGSQCLSFSEDGKRILSGSHSGVRVWNVELLDDRPSVGMWVEPREKPLSVAFTPNGKLIVVALGEGVLVLDASTGEKIGQIRKTNGRLCGYGGQVVISLNGDLVASILGLEAYISTITGTVVAGPLKSDRRIMSIAFSAFSNNLVAYGDRGGIVHILDASTGAMLAGPKQICYKSVSVDGLALLPDGIRVAVRCNDKVVVWDSYSGVIAGPFAHDTPLAFSPDGWYVTSDEVLDDHRRRRTLDYKLSLSDSRTGNIVKGPVRFSDSQKASMPSKYKMRAISLIHGGHFRMAFEGNLPHTILVFDVINKGDNEIDLQGPLELGGYFDDVSIVEFSRDGQFLVTESEGTIRIWDLQAAKHRQTHIDSADEDSYSEIACVDTAYMDGDGWVVCRSRRGGPPKHLMWVPEMHRKYLHLPIRDCVVLDWNRQKETSLDLVNFVHGKDWFKCHL